jgi:hypothetical protein
VGLNSSEGGGKIRSPIKRLRGESSAWRRPQGCSYRVCRDECVLLRFVKIAREGKPR